MSANPTACVFCPNCSRPFLATFAPLPSSYPPLQSPSSSQPVNVAPTSTPEPTSKSAWICSDDDEILAPIAKKRKIINKKSAQSKKSNIKAKPAKHNKSLGQNQEAGNQ